MTGDPSPEEDQDDPNTDFVEVDPTGRYGRYNEVLGKGAFKTVYKAFDELEGIEVAWNQVKVTDLLRNTNDLDRLYSEVHLLKTLKHKNIIKFYNSWIDANNDNINFITEVFTSGTLRQYRKKHKYVDIRALKKWSKQILSGLLYLHSHDPPVIHRDLKCDNIFVNGNQGEVKIGDLGLAAILLHAHSAHSVIGTPEFMAPELYEEEYNELVDIYAFGMCLLELVTFEYPYTECSNAAQIYKKVISGVKPASLAKVKDADVKSFIEKCIANVSERLTARELLLDPFLQDSDNDSIGHSLRPSLNHTDWKSGNVGYSNATSSYEYDKAEPATTGLDFTVEGQRKDLNTIFLKLRIADSTGQIRNIHFPFDIEADTSVSVATEMVAELDLTYQDIPAIAAVIDAEIQVYIPDWKPLDNHGNDATVSGSDGHDSEAEDEVSALPNELDYPSGCLSLERLPSGRRYWSDSPKGNSAQSPSNRSYELDSHESENISGLVYERKDDSFSKIGQQEIHSTDIYLPEQQVHSLNSSNDDENKVEISSRLSSKLRNPSCKGLTEHHEEAGTTSGSKLCDCGASFDLHECNDKHSRETSLITESEQMQSITRKLEHLLIEQQKELDVVLKKHNVAIEEILRGLPSEQHGVLLNECRSKVDSKKQKIGVVLRQAPLS